MIDDTHVVPYLKQLTGRLGNSAGAGSSQVRITRSSKLYAVILSNRVLYISVGMLGRVEDEAELAGLISHEFAHLVLRRQVFVSEGVCVLDPLRAPTQSQDLRDGERQATARAVSTLKTASYDPTSLLSLLSKLSYEHPAWAKAISSDDIRDLSANLESEIMPPIGYRLNSSDFVQMHTVVVSMLPKVLTESEQPVLRVRRN